MWLSRRREMYYKFFHSDICDCAHDKIIFIMSFLHFAFCNSVFGRSLCRFVCEFCPSPRSTFTSFRLVRVVDVRSNRALAFRTINAQLDTTQSLEISFASYRIERSSFSYYSSEVVSHEISKFRPWMPASRAALRGAHASYSRARFLCDRLITL